MIDQRRSVPILVTLIVALAACGGGSGATSGPTTSAAGPGQSQAAGTEPSQAAEAPPSSEAPSSAAAAPEPPAGGGGQAGDVCALVPADELGGILGRPVRTTVIAGPPDTCDVQSADGAPLAAFVLTNMQGVSATFVFDAFAGSPTAEQISGIGEKAAYDPNQGALVVLKNGAVLSIAVFDDGTAGADVVLGLMKQIGSAAAGRM
jgi:hypothetical protein